MAGSKRERELARAKYERQQARRAETATHRKKRQRIIAATVVGVLVVGALAWVVIGRGSSEDLTASDTTPTASSAPSAAPTAAASGDPASAEPALLDCSEPGVPRADDMTYTDAPAPVTSASSITFTTNCGDIVVALDPKAPATIASMAFLAEEGYFDNTSCHRLTTAGIYVLQCGDPKGDGTGGPGYSVPDENLPADSTGEANYPAGTVAMANAGPGTAGSQFFIVYDDTSLPGDYTIWGTVTSGLDIVQEVASVGVAGGGATDGAPQQPVFIESATVGAE